VPVQKKKLRFAGNDLDVSGVSIKKATEPLGGCELEDGPTLRVLTRVEPSETIAAILQKIDASVTDPEMYDEDESHPTEDVVRGIKELVQRTEGLLPGERFPTAIVRPFDGSIRITWVKESGSVRLVYSENPVERYIFHEEVLGGRSNSSGIDPDPTPRSLASWLEWLNSR
jgi:hypothetical protein